MSLPINIDNLLTGKSVEWERLEFKRSWDKHEAGQAIAAFANDINNWGGGYLVIGIEEKNGQPTLPPYGINPDQIDKIQKELLGLCNILKPPFFPIVEPVEYLGKMTLVIWVPTSETRPHKAPSNRGKPYDYKYYIRRFSNTVVANQKEELDLIETSAKTPFDDRVNQHCSIDDLDINLIRSHLAATGSSLLSDINNLEFEELCRKMNIVSGPDENILPKNIGLLLFNPNPTQFFRGARIDIVQFRDSSGKAFSEKIFTGPIQQQLQDALVYFKNTVIVENIIKRKDKAQADRVFNYPYDAIEEALVNTVYHRSYADDSPIEIRIHPDRIEMISYPGPLPPLTKKKLREGKIAARKYRNSRMGDFLKELQLTEGRGTGIPTIISAMAENGSPAPEFDTDDDLRYFHTTLKIHPSFTRSQGGIQDGFQVGIQDGFQVDIEKDNEIERLILEISKRPKKRQEILGRLDLFNSYKNYKRYIKPLVDKGWITPTIPDKPTSRNQQYRTTPDGIAYLNGNTESKDDKQNIPLDDPQQSLF
ncbi:hypothetical protein B7Y94_03515 [Candidatus Saccharibacteria bacterium 32-49-12]|nr:MAG: hypothetical protein B7Y94_03515 [Candidatus Saccharibacteria bacterium 32-49-12]